MANLFPRFQTPKSGGIEFVNQPGAANFRALRVDVGDQHLYWQPTYQNILRVEGAFGEFFPQAEFFDNGNRVLFTKHIEGVEVLCKTRALRSGERIPRREWVRFLATWQSFKLLADRSGIPDDFRNFIIKFGPPSVERYPAAYRIYRKHWYSRPRLFILWGLEPVGGADFIGLSPEQAISEVDARVETDREEASSQVFLWLKALACFLLACVLLLFVVWLCLPRPVVDFELNAQATQSTKPINKTGFDQDWVWGQTAYGWIFDRGQPATSNEKEPQVLWDQPGMRDATLQVTQSTLWGFLYKTEAKSKSILVKEAPKPPMFKPTPVDPVPNPTSVDPLPIPVPVEPTPDKPTPDKPIPDPTPVEPTPVNPVPDPNPVRPVPIPTPLPGKEQSKGDNEKSNKSEENGKGTMKGSEPQQGGQGGAEKPPEPATPRTIKPIDDLRNRVLNAPQIAVTRETVTEDGKSQELEFIASASAGTRIDKVSIDGEDVVVSPDGRFRKLLVSGKHDIRVDYSSPSQNIHESVNIPLTVDADKVVKPNNRLGPPTKVPNEGQGAPVEPAPVPEQKPSTADSKDKKLA